MTACPCPHHPFGCYGHPTACLCVTEPVVTIKLMRRQDGGLRVFSDDVPGLILSGTDPEKVMADVWPALQTIVTYKAA